jgi:2-polyprenyl-3-methyl-5-hydroxy-6-metoxy-1,4-benzoquinol methylase
MARVNVDNSLYDRMGDQWYVARDHPVALLRAESRWRNPWVTRTLREYARQRGVVPRVLDIGTGGGLLANALAAEGFAVVGVDQP